jgi:3',5'-cyclic AMP phosphodiesterase CpdA
VEPLLTPAALPGRTIRVSPDPRRAELPAARIVARLRTASAARGRGPLLDYAFALGRHVVGIVLDTIPRGGGTSIVSPSQLAWLEQQLARARDRYVIVFTHAPLPRTINGDAALSLLDADPHVVAAVAGDVHRNEIEPRRVRGRGYWLITTASLADYPQQARAFRLVRTVDGGVVLQTWMLDTDPRNRLARISRELAYLDYQGGRVTRLAGERSDRNADLYR